MGRLGRDMGRRGRGEEALGHHTKSLRSCGVTFSFNIHRRGMPHPAQGRVCVCTVCASPTTHHITHHHATPGHTTPHLKPHNCILLALCTCTADVRSTLGLPYERAKMYIAHSTVHKRQLHTRCIVTYMSQKVKLPTVPY